MRDEDGSSPDESSEASQSGTPAATIAPIVAEAATRVLDILRSQGRGRFEDAARWGRRRLELYQASKDIEALYSKLGRELVCLVEAGEVEHPGLVKRAIRIRDEEARYAAAKSSTETASGADPAKD
jgi:ribosomal protein S6